MSFASLVRSSLPESTLQAETEIEKTAAELKIPPSALSHITTIVRWKEFLTTTTEENRALLLRYLQETGFIPKNRTSFDPVFRNHQEVQKFADSLVERFADGSLDLQSFLATTYQEHRKTFPLLSQAQFKLLLGMIKHQSDLTNLDVSTLDLQCPFPITHNNYFGRFISSGCETPQKAARHLQIASPLLVQVRNILDGLKNSEYNFLEISVFSSAEEEYKAQGMSIPPDKRLSGEDRLKVSDLLHAAIKNSADLYGTNKKVEEKLRLISFPSLPNINFDHIDDKKYRALAVALYDWLFFDKKDSPLLKQRTLTSAEERSARHASRRIETRTAKLSSLLSNKPKSGAPQKEKTSWQSEVQACKSDIAHFQKTLIRLESNRSSVVPLIEQLEKSENSLTAVKKFRKAIAFAQQRGEKIVFTTLPRTGDSASKTSKFMSLLDEAFVGTGRNKSQSTELLRSSAMILCPASSATMTTSRSKVEQSSVETRLRKILIDAEDLNSSAKLVLGKVLPKPEDPQLARLVTTILKLGAVPGIAKEAQLNYLVQRFSDRAVPKAEDYLDFLFKKAPAMSQEQLHKVLHVMYELDVKQLPGLALRHALHRFRHPAGTLDAYGRYSRSYRPERLGALPEIFTDLASFENYAQRGLDSLGVVTEVNKIQEHLATSGIVAIVDGTNYHPELNVEVGMTGDKLEKEDSEKTTEVWGEYVQPYERVCRALGVRLIEGDVIPELQNCSLIGVTKPDKVSRVFQKIIKKFYGIDIEIEPDLSQINHVLAHLKTYDQNVILVLDARNISKLEEYQKFIDLLSKYGIKIILRTREPFPGIPQVNIQPFLDHTLTERVMLEGERLQTRLNLPNAIPKEVVQFATEVVSRCRQTQADPLNLTLQVLYGAASYARLKKVDTLMERHVNAAIPPIFHMLDGEQMRLRIKAIESFKERAPLYVMGQEKAINKISDRVINHMQGLRDPTRPLTLLLPGPTGVGKTELLLTLARICDLPFFLVEGAEFNEPHTLSRLVGSPSGYQGDDEGPLYKFAKENIVGLVFFDEVEKMHPAVIQGLMNFWDKATLTAGNGATVSRPGFIIVGASNAGASELNQGLKIKEIKEILARAFKSTDGRDRPELVARFEPIVMSAIERSDFSKMLEQSLLNIGTRHGFINANLRLTGADDVAKKLLFERCQEACAFQEKITKLGFAGTGEKNIRPTETFYDLRHVSRAIDDLVGDSLRRIVKSQHENGMTDELQPPVPVILKGDEENESIVVQVVV